MHSHQVKTCRLCMSPEHVVKDCPDFTCYKCEERGHFARDCNTVKCPDCKKFLNKCECWFRNEEEEGEQMNRQEHEGDGEKEKKPEDHREVKQQTSRKMEDRQMYTTNKLQIQQEGEVLTQKDMSVYLESVLDRAEQRTND
ncbi:hypothetical protein AMELA_G00292810 [Ameiurus melas]|uniref:CCHC-type domain-containing protein n=1 Tax=Ameiurus melas TaxID=219545 RepID=A0A7J5ZHY9_AMEME|nr:hypothetical protein AMELA_G00292810 [Ameiurus melas]